MKIKMKETLKTASQKSMKFEKDGDTFWINRKFIQRTKKGVIVEFPKWATQIYVKHDGMMYQIFLQDFSDYMIHKVPIPFHLHFPKKPEKQPRPIKKTKVEYEVVRVQVKPIISDYKQPVKPFESSFSLEPTHDELVMARRNDEI